MARKRIILGLAILVMGAGLTMAGGFFGSGDTSNPLDPTYFGAGTADSPYCNQPSWYLWSPC